jgi:tripartite-type tricarboxylate transporter receptor subunit TctC
MRLRTSFKIIGLTLICGLLNVNTAIAQSATWPDKPVKILVGFAPGGFTDVLARALAAEFTNQFKQPFVVENRSGASGTIGTTAAVRSAPDGYTLLLGHSTPNAIAAALFPKLPYDPIRDLTPIAQVAIHPHVLVVAKSAPWQSVQELIADARKNPGTINYASSGVGTVQHVAGEMLAASAKVTLNHIPYRGSGPALVDIVNGTVSMSIDGAGVVASQVAAGNLRLLAAGSAQRISKYPDLPTLQELGYSGVDAVSWFGLFAPAGLPTEITAALEKATKTALSSPALEKVLSSGGARPGTLTGVNFKAFIQNEIDAYKNVMRDQKFDLR